MTKFVFRKNQGVIITINEALLLFLRAGEAPRVVHRAHPCWLHKRPAEGTVWTVWRD